MGGNCLLMTYLYFHLLNRMLKVLKYNFITNGQFYIQPSHFFFRILVLMSVSLYMSHIL